MEKWMLSIKVLIFVVIPGIIIQHFVRLKGLNILDMNIIIASLLTGAVFLIGFMLSGTLADFKESEKIVGKVANNILSIQDHNRIEKNSKNKKELLKHLTKLTVQFREWLEQRAKLEDVLESVSSISTHIARFKAGADFGSRVEGEQKELRENILRISVIKDTTFIKAGYSIMEVISLAVIILILFSNTDTFILGAATYASSSFILVYMILLIRDMDDPFEFRHKGVAEVSILPVKRALKLLEKEKKRM